MYVLGIETSCDETGVALLRTVGDDQVKVVNEIVSSQVALHELYGGVVPELAAREHLKNLPILVDTILRRSGIGAADLGGVAVTRGPGLKGCLLMGCSFAKGISLAHNIPLIGVNHIEGHLLVPLLDNKDLSFPYLALVVSGGHTEIVLVKGVGDYTIFARTLDDAAGEAFDKSAALIGFPYPGGPKLAAAADTVGSSRFSLPKVMRESSDFSFSGLKTAIRMLVKENEKNLDEVRAELSFTVQHAIVETLCEKLLKVSKECGVKTVIVTGGVSANKWLRTEVGRLFPGKVYFPSPEHSLDNGVMIGFVGALRLLRGERSALDSDVLARWWVESLEQPHQ
jgi:N6-L-threonylcarbamoyladenine synthase